MYLMRAFCIFSSVLRALKLYFVFFSVAFSVHAQTPSFNFQKLGSEEGLSNANIFNIEQHQNGLMYFTTQNGIYTYDGYNFFKLEIDSLRSNTLLGSVLQGNNELYLSIRDEGIANFNFKNKHYSLIENLKLDNNADNIIVTENFAYLLTSGIKLVIVNLKSGEIFVDEIKKKDHMNRAFCIYKTSEGKVLVGRSNGLYDVTDGHQKRLDVLKNVTVHSITQQKNRKLIIGTSNKIYVLNKEKIEEEISPAYKTKSTTFQVGGEKSIDKIISDDYGRIWFTSYPNENLYLYQNKKVYDIFEILDIPPTLINCIYKDNQQNIWIGTFNDGAYFIQNTFFNSINFSYNGKSLNVNQVYLKHNLLVSATGNGLYGLNLSTNQTKVLSSQDEILLDPIYNITEQNGIMYYAKRSEFDLKPAIFMDAKETYKFRPVIARQFYPIENSKSIVADWFANILLCNEEGTKTLDTLISFSDYRISVNALLKLDNILYVGTSNGLFTYDFKTRHYQNIVRNELNYNINDMALINGTLYAAHEAGITDISNRKLIEKVGKFQLNSVKKIKQFNQQIWLATLDGVFICNQNFEPVKVLNKSNGLLSNSVNDFAFNNETVSIATARGVATTDLKNIIHHTTQLKPVTITHINCNGKILQSDNNDITLEADEEDISIYFLSPIFSKPNKQFFRYKLDNGEWKYFSDNLSLNLQLTGGTHLVEISASADNIVWSDNAELKIYKKEKFSEKQAMYWLITLGSLFVIVIISFIWIRRVKIKAKKRLKEEQEVNLLKHQAMNSLLSPHFIFNSLTSIQNYINTNNSLRASEYLAKFSRLIRMIIEKAAQSNISLHDELARLTYYLELEKERFKNKFDYSIHIDEDIHTQELMIPNMIIQPYVENSILHGILPKQAHGELRISFKKTERKKITITIEDNGIGLIKAQEHAKTGHKSLGTSTIQNILDINSKLSGKKQKVVMIDKSTLNTNETGTIITIELEQ